VSARCSFSTQQTEDARKIYEQHDVKAYFFPPNCTDVIQPVDRHLAQQLKKKMADLLDERLVEDEQFSTDWYGLEAGTFPAWRVRVEITKLAAEAWTFVCERRDFRRLGLETGCLMPKVGVDLANLLPIKIKDVEAYSFADALPIQNDAMESEDDVDSEDDVNLVSAQEEDDKSAPNAATDSDEEEELDVDNLTDQREQMDDTADETEWGVGAPTPPAGFVVAPCPAQMPTGASLVKRKVLWAIQVTRLGSPGWIVCQVAGGPPDPRRASQGVTMCLKCTRRLDNGTPKDLIGDGADNAVAFTLDNYGRRWCLLDEVDQDSAS
jgi:hypothetical protein